MTASDNNLIYQSGAASLFHGHAARGTQKKSEPIWAYCPTCWIRTEQTFERDEGKFEVYRCMSCGTLHRIAVR